MNSFTQLGAAVRVRTGTVMLLATLVPMASNASDQSELPAERNMAISALTGVKFSTLDAFARGRASQAMVDCVDALQPEALSLTYRQMFELVLTPDEIAVTEALYGGPLSSKLTKLSLAMVYKKHGLQSPSGDPDFLPAESAQMDQFMLTSAGRKLFLGSLMEPQPQMLLNDRLHELFLECQRTAGGP